MTDLKNTFAHPTLIGILFYGNDLTVFLGAFAAILVSYLISSLVPIHVIHEEILARTTPNIIDLGIAIAAGAAGSFSLTRKSIANSIAGVAIAVALVPPLCVVGIGLAIGNDIRIAPVQIRDYNSDYKSRI